MEILLDSMFVHPKFIGQGIGRRLLQDLEQRIKAQGISKIIVFSDPNSEGFYARFGFKVIGKKGTSLKNRFLPIMQKVL